MPRVPGRHVSNSTLRPERIPLWTAVFSCVAAALTVLGELLMLVHNFWPRF